MHTAQDWWSCGNIQRLYDSSAGKKDFSLTRFRVAKASGRQPRSNSELFLNENEAGPPAPAEAFGWSKNKRRCCPFGTLACVTHPPVPVSRTALAFLQVSEPRFVTFVSRPRLPFSSSCGGFRVPFCRGLPQFLRPKRKTFSCSPSGSPYAPEKERQIAA